MDLTKILSIGGKSGLYKMVGKTKTGFVVEPVAGGARMPAFPSQQISILEEISIYTVEKDLPLKEVFKKIHDREQGGKAPDHAADAATIVSYFSEVLPEYDPDLVRTSDMRKVFRWYNELLEAGILSFEEEENNLEQLSDEKS
ncbi:MAG TPA: DUF5606 domain-containing protein [Bacteroidales bacterium]|nr:DUF5606 domain-containing protein [Bacteroidales bacterium]HRZ49611.1 DUF5606 domain-containing protein [Bacteroidales bacterium]